MNDLERIILIVGLSLLFLVILYFMYIMFIYEMINKKINIRYEKNPHLKYFTHDDFPEMRAEPITFKSKDNATINGYIYTNDKVKNFNKVIIFFHGLGPGHLAYTKEIHRLLMDNNLAVIAYDNHGTNLSEGKTIIDLGWALVDADYFFRYIKSDVRFKESELILAGHSWGGYVAGNVLSVHPDIRVQKIIIINGLPAVYEMALKYTKGKVIAKYFYRFLIYLKLGKYANKATLKTLKAHHVKTLVFHGGLDSTIPLAVINPLLEYAKTVDYIKPVIYNEHHHFAYLTLEAEKALMTMQGMLFALLKAKDHEKLVTYTETIDYQELGAHHDALFEEIKTFISE